MEKAVEINRIHKVSGDTPTKAFVDIVLNGLVITGLRVVDGKNGLFLGMPRRQGKDGKWYDTVFPLSKEVHQELSEMVLEAYKEGE